MSGAGLAQLVWAVRLVERALPPSASERIAGEREQDLDFDALYRRHAQAVYARLTRLVGPIWEREDLVQQVFVQLYRALPDYRGDAPIGAFVHGIAVKVGYDYLRKRARKRTRPLGDDELAALVACSASPEAEARARGELRVAFERLDALKPKKRVAFVLHVIEGMSLEEMARMLDVDARTLGQRVAYARRELLAMYERDARRQTKGGR